MKSFLKSIFSIFLALTIIFSSVAVGLGEIDYRGLLAVKVEATSESDLRFNLDDGGSSYYVSGCSTSASGSITIPSTYNGKPVTWIDSYAFSDCTSLTSIEIPNSVGSIWNFAFSGCESLTSITIPDSITYIGCGAFSSCKNLISVHITDIEAWCNIEFYNDYSNPLHCARNLYLSGELVTELVIPDGVTSISDYAFYGCKNLTSITIPDSVISIGKYAFYDSCKAAVVIPKSVTSIGNGAFGCNCSNYINAECFKNKRFFLCYKDSYAHSYLDEKGFKYTFIGDTIEEVTEIGKVGTLNWSLNKLTGVLEINGSGKMASFSAVEAPWQEFAGLITEVKLGEGITNISYCAFCDQYRLKKTVIPQSVTVIDAYAFQNCTSLTSIEIPYSVTDIGWFAFYECKSLTSITIPDSVTSIGSYAFYNCTRLSSVTIGDSITSIGSYAFYNCAITSIAIPDSVTSIGDDAFRFCNDLTSITIPNGVTYIGSSAFNGCYGLTSITIPYSVTTIGEDAFSSCYNIETIEFALDEKNNSNLKSMPDISDTDVKNVFLPISIESASYGGFPTDIESVTVCNPKFDFNSSYGLNYNSTIIGFKGSTAESFAEEIVATFVDIESVHTHNYKAFKEKGYCFFSRCTCGKEKTKGHTPSDWTTDKKATVNSAGKKHKECTECGEILETAEIPQLKCSKPKLKSIENTEYGVLTKWSKVTGADSYRVYRKTSKSDWKYIGTTSKTYYTDKTAKSGTKYYYAVRARNEAGNSLLSSSLSKYYLADPTLKTPSSSKTGIKLTWSKVSGADGYMVYRKTGTGSYSRIATVKGSTKVTYTDKSAKKGKKYTYKVKAYKSKTYSAYSNTKTITDKY